LDNRRNGFDGQWFDVDAVGDALVGHDGRGVGVHQDGAYTFFAKRLAGLGSRVIELGRLADHDRPGPDDQDAGGRRTGSLTVIGAGWIPFTRSRNSSKITWLS